MIKEKEFFIEYKVLEIKRNKAYEYYLEKIGYGNLFYLYGTMEECMPKPVEVLRYSKIANAQDFWGIEQQ